MDMIHVVMLNGEVVIFKSGNAGYGKYLAEMPGVSWVQTLTPNGYLCDPSDSLNYIPPLRPSIV